jgi:hypothetical protein
MKWKPRIHSAPLTREPGRAVTLGRVLVLTCPNFNDLFIKSGSPSHPFIFRGMTDSSYRPYKDATTSVGGHVVFLYEVPIAEKPTIQHAIIR